MEGIEFSAIGGMSCTSLADVVTRFSAWLRRYSVPDRLETRRKVYLDNVVEYWFEEVAAGAIAGPDWCVGLPAPSDRSDTS